MDHYKEMYSNLFNKITDVINELQTVQLETEEMFISQEEEKQVLQILTKTKHTD